jgi:hypothetical protein
MHPKFRDRGEMKMSKGSLTCVGLGMTLGAHLAPRARRTIETADVVFVHASDGIVEQWVGRMHADVRSLQPHYAAGPTRRDAYRGMIDAMLAEVCAGRTVCAAFYGHPGVFAEVPHRAIAQARAAGYPTHMEPAVSAADCLYADVGFDPGVSGCQHYEATQFLIGARRIDTAAWLVLWQPAVVGDLGLARRSTTAAHRALLAEVLARDYPATHPLIVYRAATLPFMAPLIRHHTLAEIPAIDFDLADTLALPPAAKPVRDPAILQRLAAIEAASSP